MSDLQCPARFLVVGPEADLDQIDATSLCGVYAMSARAHDARTLATRVGCEVGPIEQANLAAEMEALSDLHRGYMVAVLPADVAYPLRSATDLVNAAIDADGWVIERY